MSSTDPQTPRDILEVDFAVISKSKKSAFLSRLDFLKCYGIADVLNLFLTLKDARTGNSSDQGDAFSYAAKVVTLRCII